MARTSRVEHANDRSKDKQSSSAQLFGEIANSASRQAGRAPIFVAAVALVLIWAVTGPLFEFSDTWQLVINTGTTIVTFLMVFLIQNSQNRDGASVAEASQYLLYLLLGIVAHLHAPLSRSF
ncbi:low affinity iron permease family protein (plasmid) [Nitrobacter sp. NHB1]